MASLKELPRWYAAMVAAVLDGAAEDAGVDGCGGRGS
jgi:hypothetical protein